MKLRDVATFITLRMQPQTTGGGPWRSRMLLTEVTAEPRSRRPTTLPGVLRGQPENRVLRDGWRKIS